MIQFLAQEPSAGIGVTSELIGQSPIAAAMIVLVLAFLKAMAKRDEILKEMREESHRRADEILARDLQVQESLRNTLEENAKAFFRVEKILDRLANGIAK